MNRKGRAFKNPQKALLHALFVTALEGGVNHWSECVEYRWATDEDGRTEDLDGFRAVLHPPADTPSWGVWDDAKDKSPITVDRNVIKIGLDRWLEWMTTDLRNHVGGERNAESTWKWERDPHRPQNEYWDAFLADVQKARFDDADFDADLADTIVQLGLFNEVVFA